MRKHLLSLAILLGLAIPASAQISLRQLDAAGAASAITGTDIFPVEQNNTYPLLKATAAQIATFALGQTTGDCSFSVYAITCTKTGGLAFGYFATGTNAGFLSGTAPVSVLPVATTSSFGAVKPDGTTVTISAGVISAVGGGGSGCSTSGSSLLQGNGSGGCSNVTVNSPMTLSSNTLSIGSASSSVLGVAKCDGVTITCGSGVMASGSSVVAGTTQNITANQWQAGTAFVVTTGGQTLTLPASSTLTTNGGIAIQTIGQSVTLAPNAADAINGGTTGASVTIAAGLTAYATTDGAGNVRVSPIAAGSGVTQVVCGTGLSGGTITTTGTCSVDLTHANIWTGQQTFATVLGGENDQSGTTYTLAASDCGKTVAFSNASAVTVTIPASIVPSAGTTCNIIIRQDGAGQVAVNGSAVSAATLVTHVASGAATKTAGQHAVIGLQLTTISSVASAVLTGDGA